MLKKIIENSTKGQLRIIIRHAVYIVLIAAVAGFTVNLFHPKGFILVGKSSEKNKNIVFISSEEAKIKRENKSAVFIDSRPDDEFETSHIPGAINIPAVPEPEQKIKEYTNLINSQKELVIYCDGIECGSSQILGNILIDKGYSRHIYIIRKGIPEWTAKGFPLEKKPGKEGTGKQ
jgi:rhodanese-related sulfurtransferase